MLISVAEASQIVIDHQLILGEEYVSLENSMGRILREDLIADRTFPPFDRVTMDGIAIAYAAFEKGQREFPIQEIQAAGMEQKTMSHNSHCMEVMTGAILPSNTDTVIRYEDLDINDGIARIVLDQLKFRQNIHFKGNDRPQGEVIVEAGGKISAAEIGVAATIGKTTLKVAQIPKAVIITTGDELVEVAETPLPHQIRSSNVYKIKSTLHKWGVPAVSLHLIDDKAAIKASLQECLENFEVIILSGGVSKGKFDFVPEVLEDLAVVKLFHRVAQRPGKPFWFGQKDNTCVFALPGNPVSSFMCLHRYFRPWLNATLNLPTAVPPHAILQEDFNFRPDLTYYLQVKIQYNTAGQILAFPLEGNGSGDLANLVDADAFLEIPRGKELFKKGEIYPLMIYRN